VYAGASLIEQVGHFLLPPLTEAKPVFPSFSADFVSSAALVAETPKLVGFPYRVLKRYITT